MRKITSDKTLFNNGIAKLPQESNVSPRSNASCSIVDAILTNTASLN